MKTWEAMCSKFISEEAPRLPPLTPTYPNSVLFCTNACKFTCTSEQDPIDPLYNADMKANVFFRKRSLPSMLRAHSAQPLHPGVGIWGHPVSNSYKNWEHIDKPRSKRPSCNSQPSSQTKTSTQSNSNLTRTLTKLKLTNKIEFETQILPESSPIQARHQPHVVVASLHPMGLGCPADAAPSALHHANRETEVLGTWVPTKIADTFMLLEVLIITET